MWILSECLQYSTFTYIREEQGTTNLIKSFLP
jgi:hypothetical protein